MGSFQTRPMLIVHCYRVINERELQPLNPNDDYIITFYLAFCIQFIRDTQRQFSVKYLIGEANIAKNFLWLEYG